MQLSRLLVLAAVACKPIVPPVPSDGPVADAPPVLVDAAPDTATDASVHPRFDATSQKVTWTCMVSDAHCPWGPTLSNQALAWPLDAFPFAWRLGYQADAGVYLDAYRARGLSVTVTSGAAQIFAGQLDSPNRFPALSALGTGQTYTVAGDLADGTVISIESQGDEFTVHVQ